MRLHFCNIKKFNKAVKQHGESALEAYTKNKKTVKNGLNPEHQGEVGMTLMETRGVIFIGLLLIAGAAFVSFRLVSNTKLIEMEQAITMVRMQTQQMFASSQDYTGLDNALAIKSGLAPKKMVKNSDIYNSWGGKITLGVGDDTGTFTVTIDQIPHEECTKLAPYQLDSWWKVDVNGTEITKETGVAAAAGNCNEGNENTIIYTSR